jgi:HD-GYP domain-containing protein (c-di-GMP phosphodiesterase class II)/HAMP domain-containing protein
MKFDSKLFHSKIARRFFIMFVCCAIIPILCLSAVSYRHVSKQLNELSYHQLKRSVKAHGMSVYERLMFLETDLQLVASYFTTPLDMTDKTRFPDFNQRLSGRFQAVAIFDGLGKHRSVYKTIRNPKDLTTEEINHINAGNTAISILNDSGSAPRIFMVRQVDLKNPDAGFLFGEINADYLWGIAQGNALPPNTDVCILNQSKNLLFSSFPNQDSCPANTRATLENKSSGQFVSVCNNKKYLVSYWSIFMKPRFLVPGWTVVVSRSETDVFAPMSHFNTTFPFIVLMSLWVVLCLSIYYIRKGLVPIELLKKGTRRIAMKDFDAQVKITSGDEFEELAEHFNEMSGRLKRQFKALDTKAEIDRAILSSLEPRLIVETVISRMSDWFACDIVSIGLIISEDSHTAKVYFSSPNTPSHIIREKFITFRPHDLKTLNDHPKYLVVDTNKSAMAYLSNLDTSGIKSFLVLPIFLDDIFKAVITIGRDQSEAYSEEDIIQARRMADQVAVALSNANLIEELDELNLGTLKALARTVDTKSSWTAGHSERVTDMALEIGAFLKLSPKEMDNLHRGSLLHDIGKIGVPVSILDKPGKLDDDEYRAVKTHPRIGARILEPIAAYKTIIPIVLQHHERYDGKGYPDGLSGDAIDLGARIVAVADVFDALKSDRPYREGWPLERVIDLITQEAGRQFDPKIVEAFLSIIKLRKKKAA